MARGALHAGKLVLKTIGVFNPVCAKFGRLVRTVHGRKVQHANLEKDNLIYKVFENPPTTRLGPCLLTGAQ
jgi:hypothetical protein